MVIFHCYVSSPEGNNYDNSYENSSDVCCSIYMLFYISLEWFIIVIPSGKFTQTLADRGWKMSFH